MGAIKFFIHRRDLLGMGHSYGTCTLIEKDSLMNLVQHFQNTYAQTSGPGCSKLGLDNAGLVRNLNSDMQA